MTCYSLIRGRTWQQEWYETSSKDAGRRTRQLRKAGFTVRSAGMESQVTPVGRIKMTLVTIEIENDCCISPPEKVIWR